MQPCELKSGCSFAGHLAFVLAVPLITRVVTFKVYLTFTWGAGAWGGGLDDALALPNTRAHLLSYFFDLLKLMKVVMRGCGGGYAATG